MQRSYWNGILVGSLLLLLLAFVAYYQIVTGQLELPSGPRPLLAGQEPTPTSSLAATGIDSGQPAPAFTLRSLDGETVSLADFRGQPVLVNFWATWCPPCRKEMPAIQHVYEQHQDADFVVLAVNVQESEETIRPFVEEMGVTFPVLLDENGDVMKQYRIMGLPSSFFVARDGTIRTRKIGEMSEEFLVNAVQGVAE